MLDYGPVEWIEYQVEWWLSESRGWLLGLVGLEGERAVVWWAVTGVATVLGALYAVGFLSWAWPTYVLLWLTVAILRRLLPV